MKTVDVEITKETTKIYKNDKKEHLGSFLEAVFNMITADIKNEVAKDELWSDFTNMKSIKIIIEEE